MDVFERLGTGMNTARSPAGMTESGPQMIMEKTLSRPVVAKVQVGEERPIASRQMVINGYKNLIRDVTTRIQVHVLKLAVIVGLLVMAGTVVWNIQPWIVPGKSITLGRWRFGDREFQVWQTKNNSLFEPFTTNLFVRVRNGRWMEYTLDVDDLYNPSVNLYEANGKVVVTRSGKACGTFELQDETYKREVDGAIFQPREVSGIPPG